VDLGIRGKTALVCGASRGLGKACAAALAQEGANLAIVARTRDVLERAGADIAQATGVAVTTVAADLTRRPAVLPRSRHVQRPISWSPTRKGRCPGISATGRATTGSPRSTT